MSNLLLRALHLSHAWRYWRNRQNKNARILMYHGVTEHEVPNWTQVSVAEFERQMRYLKSCFTPISLSAACEMIAGKTKLIPGAVAVTFDDGFKNNATVAYPILQKYQVPATVFLTTSFVAKEERYGGLVWTDYLYCLLQNTRATVLDLRDEGLGTYDLATSHSRYVAKGQICEKLKKLDYERKNSIIYRVAERLRSSVSMEQLSIFGSLDWTDIQRLDREGLITFGAHTVGHDILSRLPEELVRREIIESKRVIEQQLGRPIRHFAYPNGQPGDYTDREADIVREHFDCALTTIHGTNRIGDSLYSLRRIGVGRGLAEWEFELLMAGIPSL